MNSKSKAILTLGDIAKIFDFITNLKDAGVVTPSIPCNCPK